MRKIVVTGETKLTQLLLENIKKEVVCLFALPLFRKNKKTNSVDLKDFCLINEIKYIDNDCWKDLYSFCKSEQIDVILCAGDSRIVPKFIISEFYVIGNHGALLPDVKGGASLVWGKLFSEGEWGVSIFELNEKIDNGNILLKKQICYDKKDSMEDFCNLCDKVTVELFCKLLQNRIGITVTPNSNIDVKISRHLDEYFVYKVYKLCKEYGYTIYLPGRNDKDSYINNDWPQEFKNKFKKAQNHPYPIWKTVNNV